MMAITQCRVSSTQVSDKTLSRRSSLLSQLREVISGGESTAQMQSDLSRMTKAEREEVLRGAQLPVVIPTEHALALKADLALTWGKCRAISRYLMYHPIIALTTCTNQSVGGSNPSTSPLAVKGDREHWPKPL